MQYFFVALGSLFVGLGLVGIVLPLVPTTPFLLLAAACYARGSERFYRWLLNHPWFGETIRDYREGRGMRRAAKIRAILLLWVCMGTTMVFFLEATEWRWMLASIGVGISLYLIRLPTRREVSSKGESILNGR